MWEKLTVSNNKKSKNNNKKNFGVSLLEAIMFGT